MATKKFIIEVEEGDTECRECPYVLMNKDGLIVNCIGTKYSHCMDYNLATIKLREYDKESNTQTS